MINFLYGVSKGKAQLKKSLDRCDSKVSYGIRKLNPKVNVPVPERVLLGYDPGTVEGICMSHGYDTVGYGYVRNGDYFFHNGTPENITTLVRDTLDEIVPAYFMPPEELNQLRDLFMQDLNFAVNYSYNSNLEEFDYRKFYRTMVRVSEKRKREGKLDLACHLKGLLCQLDAIRVKPKKLPKLVLV